MIRLHHCVSARSFRPLWAMEEIGLDYQLLMLPFPPRVHAPEFLKVNPAGTIPAFADETTRMTESVAICEYLASRHSPNVLGVEPTDPAYGEYLNWCAYGEATLTFPQTIVLRYGRFEPPERRIPQAVDDYSRWFLARLRPIESLVSEREFLVADRFTVADISVGYALMLAESLGLRERFKPAVDAYWKRLGERDGFKRALQAQHEAALAQGVSTTSALLS